MTASSEHRIELVRRGIRAFNAADAGAVLRLLDPEVEIENSGELANAGTYHGHEGYMTWVRNWNEAWEDFQNIPEEIAPVGERHAVARVRGSGRGRGSGLEVSLTVGYVCEVRDGLCTYLAIVPSFDEAIGLAREREGMTEAEHAT